MEIEFYCGDKAIGGGDWPCAPDVGEKIRLVGVNYTVRYRGWGTCCDGSNSNPIWHKPCMTIELTEDLPTEHEPGEWDYLTTEGSNHTRCTVYKKGERAVARGVLPEDAPLISCAPDMLNMLERIANAYGDAVINDEPINGGDMVEWYGENWAEIQRLVSRAKGE